MRNNYGNIWEPPYVDKIILPAKARVIWRQHGAGQLCGSAGPRVAPLAPPFVLDTARWAPILRMSVSGLCTSVFLVKWAHLASVMQDKVFCVFMLRVMLVFPLFRVWVPANQELPKLVELVSIKPYNYVW